MVQYTNVLSTIVWTRRWTSWSYCGCRIQIYWLLRTHASDNRKTHTLIYTLTAILHSEQWLTKLLQDWNWNTYSNQYINWNLNLNQSSCRRLDLYLTICSIRISGPSDSETDFTPQSGINIKILRKNLQSHHVTRSWHQACPLYSGISWQMHDFAGSTQTSGLWPLSMTVLKVVFSPLSHMLSALCLSLTDFENLW